MSYVIVSLIFPNIMPNLGFSFPVIHRAGVEKPYEFQD